MGREVRRVPADWQHPKDAFGDCEGLHNGYNASVRDWDECAAQWAKGLCEDWGAPGSWKPIEPENASRPYAEWGGERPRAEDYMPEWPANQRTHYQMYETGSEGTPISPVFATPEDLARWLADNGASAFAGETASYEGWLEVARGKSAPSAAMINGVLMSGVEAALQWPALDTPLQE